MLCHALQEHKSNISSPSQSSSSLCCWVTHQKWDEMVILGQELVYNSSFKIPASLVVIEAVKIINYLLRKGCLRKKSLINKGTMMGRLWTLVFKLGIRCRTTITKLTYTGTFQYNYYKVMTHISFRQRAVHIKCFHHRSNTKATECKQSPTIIFVMKNYFNLLFAKYNQF